MMSALEPQILCLLTLGGVVISPVLTSAHHVMKLGEILTSQTSDAVAYAFVLTLCFQF